MTFTTNRVTQKTVLTAARSTTKLEWNGSSFLTVDPNEIAYRSVNGESEISIEGEEENLFLHNCDPEQVGWGKANLAFPSSEILAPDGSTAVIVAATADNGGHSFFQEINLAANTRYVWSFFAKDAGLPGLLVSAEEVADPEAWEIGARIDLTTGTFNNRDLARSTTDADTGGRWRRWSEPYVDGWYRYCLSFSTVRSGSYLFLVRLTEVTGPSTSVPTSFPGDSVNGVAWWCTQITPGVRPGSPIVTGATTVTRAADDLSLTGASYSSLGFGSGGVVLLEVPVNSIPTHPSSDVSPLLTFSDGTSANSVAVQLLQDRTYAYEVRNSASLDASGSLQSLAVDEVSKVSVRVSPNNMALSVEGATEESDLSSAIPAMDRLLVGRDHDGRYLNGTIKRLLIWPSASPATPSEVSRTRRRRIRVILAAGQSNAVGNGPENLEGFPDYFKNEALPMLAWNGARLLPLFMSDTGPTGNGRNLLTDQVPDLKNNGGFLFEALRLYTAERPDVVLCQVTAGGTPLAARPGFSSWNADYEAVAGTALTEELENRWESLVTYCDQEDIELVPVAMVWHQGETDNPEPWASEYGANLIALIDRVRTWSGLEGLPWISGTIPAIGAQYSANVRAGMMSAVASRSQVFYRDNDDLTIHDSNHFDPPSWLTFGTWIKDRLEDISS